MTFLRTNFQRYRWWLVVACGIFGAYSGNQVLDALPPGTDLVSAVIALYALSRQERDQVASKMVALLNDRADQHKADYVRVTTDHADRLGHISQWATAAHGYLAPEGAIARPSV